MIELERLTRTETRHRDLFVLQCLCGRQVGGGQEGGCCDEAAKTPQQTSSAVISMWERYNCTARSRSSNKLHLCTLLDIYAVSLAAPRQNSCGRARRLVWRANRLSVIATRAEIVMPACVPGVNNQQRSEVMCDGRGRGGRE